MQIKKNILIKFTFLYFLIINGGELLKASTFHFGFPPSLPSAYNILIGSPLITILLFYFIRKLKTKPNQFMFLVGASLRISFIAGILNSIFIIIYSFIFPLYFENLKRYNLNTIVQTSADLKTVETTLWLINPYASAVGSLILVLSGGFILSVIIALIFDRKTT